MKQTFNQLPLSDKVLIVLCAVFGLSGIAVGVFTATIHNICIGGASLAVAYGWYAEEKEG